MQPIREPVVECVGLGGGGRALLNNACFIAEEFTDA